MPRGRPKKIISKAEAIEKNIKELPVEEDSDLVRDVATNAIINNNRNAYQARRARISASEKNAAEIQKNAAEIQSIKDELAEIKELLKTIASK